VKFPSRRQFIAVASLVIAGCKRSADPTPPATSAPAASRPAVGEATLTIDGEPETFPPVELLVRHDGSSLVVELSTTESPGPAGESSMRFSMTFQGLDNPDELDGATWQFVESPDSEQESLNRIDLHHRAALLLPTASSVTLRLDGPEGAIVRLTGMFNLFDPPDAEKPVRVVKASGVFEATLKQEP